MKAICIRQPWAGLIAGGQKTIEIRTWRSHYRGPFVVCASLKRVPKALRERYPGSETWPAGVTLCVCELVDVREAVASDAEAACCDIDVGREYAWLVRVVRPLEPRPVSGRLGFFEVDDG